MGVFLTIVFITKSHIEHRKAVLITATFLLILDFSGKTILQ